MEVDRLSEGLTRINMDMEADAKHGVYWPGFVALGAATFAIFNFLTRWLLPGETCLVCPESTRSTHFGQPVPTQKGHILKAMK